MSGKVVAVTGGASGIGLETARLLAERGYAPFLLDLKQEALATACAELGIAPDRGIACDVTDEASVDRAFEAIAAAGTLAAVVNCAGIATDKPAVDTSVEEFRRIVDVNLTGNKGRVAYGASKGGQNLLTLVMANELGVDNIRVNAVAPGPVDTPLTKAVHTEDVRRQWVERVPQRRYGTTREIASAVAFLISDDASYVNGQILAVDGGFIHAGLAA